jgi:two-component system cell cycle response regulator
VVSRVPVLRALAPMIRAHHERWDGTGYPDGLAGDSIPLGARLVAAADAYGAMTSDRPYRQASTPAYALAELRRCAGAQFDPAVVAALERVLGADPQLPASAQHDDAPRARRKQAG